jgi:fructose-1,6-bisphosphatase I/sedoheptulose-1,7-bisphosphatase
MNHQHTKLADFLAQQLPSSRLGKLLLDIAVAVTAISAMTVRGSLDNFTDKLTSQNIQGETQVQLDVLTNEIFIQTLTNNGTVSGLASEEMDYPIALNAASDNAEFLVVFDPLDGSSNVAVNVSVGSIFSILAAPKNRAPVEADYLQKGRQQLAAGYAIYGPATMLVITTGNGTHGFTLDPNDKTFYLTHPAIQIPETSAEFAINASNQRHWEAPISRYVEECLAGTTGLRARDFNMRWVASMVADVHRILIRGGIYLYPRDYKQPIKAGRLRLMYEANPMSMLVEQANGKSSTGRIAIMEVVPDHVHQRVPVIMGSKEEVALVEQYHYDFDKGAT